MEEYNSELAKLSAVCLFVIKKSSKELKVLCTEFKINLFDNNFEIFNLCKSIIESKKYAHLLANELKQIDIWQKQGVSHLSYLDPRYPEKLRNIDHPPLLLFARGNLECLSKRKNYLAIVGSRTADARGKQIAEQFASELASSGVCIVSGLAYGIDAAAHKGAIRNGNTYSTIAILGNGLPNIYPSANRHLAEQIIENDGLLISQFLPNTTPRPHHFLERNRIIAAITDLTLVIQANEKSGSLVTARFASELGKSVATVPGSIDNSLFDGNHKLIKTGAYLVTNSQDLADLLPNCYLNRSTDIDRQKELPQNESNLLKLIKSLEVADLETLYSMNREINNLLQLIFNLESKGLIKKIPGNSYILSN